VAPLGVIDFTFTASEYRIHKTVHHFLMFAEGGELTDDDAEIDEVAWVPFAELHDRLSYADERELLSRVPELLASAS
jgi:ADP-ribose pyrophosphatase YjhB (NUDIX family)